MIPSTGWLDESINRNAELLQIDLPVPYYGSYGIGETLFDVADTVPVLTTLMHGGPESGIVHGFNKLGLYGLLAQLILFQAYGYALIDTIDIPEIIGSNIYFKEECPPDSTKTIETTSAPTFTIE